MSKKKTANEMALYTRCYLVTFGLIIAGLAIFFGFYENIVMASNGFIVVISFVLLGVILIFVGIVASADRVSYWGDVTSRHEIALVLIAIAFPLYWVVKQFARKK